MSEIDVCVPVHNALPFVKRCLESLVNNPPGGVWRIIIHDDASDDQTRDWLRGWAMKEDLPPVILVRSDHQVWFTTSVNRCLQQVGSEWILVVNSDIEIQDSDWFPKCETAWMLQGGAGLIGQADGCSVTGRCRPDPALSKIQGHWWFMRTSDFRRVGLLRETEPSEVHIRSDDAWSEAWRKAGYQNYLMTNLRIRHGCDGTKWPGGGASWDRDLNRLPKWIDVLRARAHEPTVERFRC